MARTRPIARLLLLLSVLAIWVAAAGDTRFHQFTARFKEPPDQATVVAATLFGGKGTEWFAAGGFQPDGTVVAAGTALGPVLEAGGAVLVLGTAAVCWVASAPLARNRSCPAQTTPWTVPESDNVRLPIPDTESMDEAESDNCRELAS